MNRRITITLTAGYCLLFVAVVSAFTHPVSGYEVSIYRATPLSFWVGSIGAGSVAIALMSYNLGRKEAILLFILSVFVTISLPIVRGYYFIGEGDSLSHLGRAKMLLEGTKSPNELFYPALHLHAIVTSTASGVELRPMLMMFPFIIIACFIVLVPLFIRRFFFIHRPVFSGLVSSALILPINWTSVNYTPHSISQAIFFTPLVLFCILLYLRQPKSRNGILLGTSFLGILLLHPQLALNVLAILVVGLLIQIINRKRTKQPFYELASGAIPTLWAGLVFWLWVQSRSKFTGGFQAFILPLVEKKEAAREVTDRGASLSQIGTGLDELFVKLFFVSLAYSLMTAGVVISVYSRYIGWEIDKKMCQKEQSKQIVMYLSVGFIPSVLLLILTLLGSVTTQAFRYLGALMVLSTILGALFLGRFMFDGKQDNSRLGSSIATIAIVVLLLFATIPVYHPSPYIFKPNSQVTETSVNGYEVAISNTEPETPIVWTRSPVERYADVLYGTDRTEHVSRYNITHSNQVSNHFDKRKFGTSKKYGRYLAITEGDKQIDTGVYNGFRFNSGDFRYLTTSQNIAKIQSNGDFRLYYAKGTEQDLN